MTKTMLDTTSVVALGSVTEERDAVTLPRQTGPVIPMAGEGFQF